MSPTPGPLAVVIVHYRTPELLRSAIEHVETTAEVSGLEIEGVVVDNGSKPADRPLLTGDTARRWRLIEPGHNLGYAGGVNRGVEATSAAKIVVMNPDVEVGPGCLASLSEALDRVDIAGPRFSWDRGGRFSLPPTEGVSRFDELLRTLADRGAPWTPWARRRWRRHARRHWLADQPLASFDLSGALLAFRRDAWQRVGPFDEGYPLYFEETDWLQRARRKGASALFLPGARTVHLYAQSTVREGRSGEWFEASSRRFRTRFYGARFFRWLTRLAPENPSPAPPRGDAETDIPSSGAWLEVSPSPRGFPAAGCRLEPGENPELPEEIIGRLAPGCYLLTLVDTAGRELSTRPFDKLG